MEILPNSHHWRKPAASKTSDAIDAELLIGCRLTFLDVQFSLDLLENLDSTLDVTRRSQAHEDGKLPLGFQAERFVERRQVVRSAHRYMQIVGNKHEDILREIVEFILDVQQDLDDYTRILWVALKDRIDNLCVFH